MPRIPLSLTVADLPFTLQLPVRPAFAMSNKAQGQTLQCVKVFLGEPTFSRGQLYQAVSRCDRRICVDSCHTANVVYDIANYCSIGYCVLCILQV